MSKRKDEPVIDDDHDEMGDYISEHVDGLKIKHDDRGPYYQKSSKSKRRYFDESKPEDQERARRVASRD